MSADPLAVFTADFPDDHVDDVNNIVLYGGRNVADAIRQLLSARGCEVSGLAYEGEKGWSFVAKFEGQVFWCQTTSFHPTYFLDLDKPSTRNSTKSETFAKFWQVVDAALRNDGRIHDVQWHQRKDAPDPWENLPESAGAPSLDSAVSDAQIRERIRTKQRESREFLRFERWNVIGVLACGFGLIIAGGGTLSLANGAPEATAEIVSGLAIALLSSLGLWILSRYRAAGRSRLLRDNHSN